LFSFEGVDEKRSGSVMSEAESRAVYYREQALQIRALVPLVVSVDIKAELLELAAQFERLADSADRATSL